MWGYYVDPRDVSWWEVALVFAGYAIPFLLGFVAARRLEARRRGASWAAIAGSLAAGAALLAWQWPRYRTVSTLEEFRAGVKVPVTSVPLLSWEGPLSAGILVALLLLARAREFPARRSLP